AVKSRKTEDMRSIQEEMNLHQQRTDQQKQVSEREVNIKEHLQGQLKEIKASINTGEKRLEEEMKILTDALNSLPQQSSKLNPIYTGSSLVPAAAAAPALSIGAFAPQAEKWSLGSWFISSTDTAAAQQQQINDESLELLRRIVTMENPMTKYMKLENIGHGTFGEVCRALDPATGGEVAIKKINLQGLEKRELNVNELSVMKMSGNPTLVNCLDSYLVDKQFWLVMEYMDGGTLSDVINETQMSEGEIATIVGSTGTFAHLKPPSISSPSLDLALSVLYSVVPPALNPLIYSLRNQELKAAVWTLITG
ncbi:hypothetical protein HGM15179_017902, partial [Zosterops borbonicus]